MRLLKIIPVLTCWMWAALAYGQNPVLFEVEDEAVHLEEFRYIYEKTNRDQADFSRASVEEYLDLYKKFKLKVHKARQLQLDTIAALQTELDGYRKQLANTYLSDREVLESLVKEAYQRMQQDVRFSHILFKVPITASAETEERIYQRALDVLEDLRSGTDFAELAFKVSEDETAKENQGDVGYVTAMLPDGFYDLETALYTLPEDTYSRPIRTKLGYHIVRVENRRPARGEIEVAHILIRNKSDAKDQIDNIYEQLESGADFATVARSRSEDNRTAANGGYLGFFGINKYESPFENMAFRLQEDGSYSRPVRTSIGWHIIKRLSLKPVASYEAVKRNLEAQIKKDGRYKIAEQAMYDKIKEEHGFREMNWDQGKFLSEVGDDFLTYQWQAPGDFTNQTLFEIGGAPVKAEELLRYMTKNTATRLRINRSQTAAKSLETLYADFVNEKLRAYEESQLEHKYPEFKALMREYSEGILLFEVTKRYVWDKASQDTMGLKNYYQQNKDSYQWPPKALVETVTIMSQDEKVVDKIRKQLSKKPTQKLLKKFNNEDELIRIQGKLMEQNELAQALPWKKYALSEPETNDEGQTVLTRIAEIIPPKQKSLEEARGYIIADYQDYLESKWVEGLMAEYEVEVHEDVLDSMIKS